MKKISERNPHPARAAKTRRQIELNRKRQRIAQESDAYMLAFVGKYVDTITEYHGRGHRVDITFYPHGEKRFTADSTGKSRLEAFINALRSAMRLTDSYWNDDGGDSEIWQYLSARKRKNQRSR